MHKDIKVEKSARLAWATSMWAGTIVLSGFAGLFVGFLVASSLRSDDM